MSASLTLPLLGLGTWDLRGAACERAVAEALEIGYRHLDTAQMYDNESEVGQGLKASTVPREDVFVTTKLWRDQLEGGTVGPSVDRSLRKLDVDYLDLLLIHWPNEVVPLEETLAAMERVRASGRARAIGVSNFPVSMWERALELAPVEVNQVELHPYLGQTALIAFAAARGLQLVAYTPVAKGKVSHDSVILSIARAHRRSPTQVALRWILQQGIGAIPKSARRAHLEENFESSGFDLTDDEMARIAGLSRGLRLVEPGWSPHWD